MKRREIKVKSESGVGQHQDASYMGVQITRDQLEIPKKEDPQDQEVSMPASNSQHEEELVRLWKEYCADHEFLCRWQIADVMLPNEGKFDFAAAIGPSIKPADAIILISDMMMQAGFDVWYPFDPQEYDPTLDGVNFISILEDVWAALDLLINRVDEGSIPDYQTPIK